MDEGAEFIGDDPENSFSERGCVTLEKVEIHRILEGMFMQQVLALLLPCFKKPIRSSREAALPNSEDAVDFSSPSDSFPAISTQSTQHHSDHEPDLDFVMSEISLRTGVAFVSKKTPTIDLLVTRRLAVLTTILKNFHFNETCTKREIYYRNESLFDSQAQCDVIIEQFASQIHIPQHQLMITYNSKGLVYGKLRIYTDSCNFIACDCNPDQGMLIPSIVYDGEDNIEIRNPRRSDGVPDGQHTVLVIEKATVFQRLLASKFVEQCQNTVTIVTGGGYPDLPTRRFVALCHQANFRVLGIADCDPFGIEIMLIYKWGSICHIREKDKLSATNLEWVGLKPEHLADTPDSISFGGPKQPLLPIDRRKINSVIQRLQAIEDEDADEWLAQTQLMSSLDCKCELEILHETVGLESAVMRWVMS